MSKSGSANTRARLTMSGDFADIKPIPQEQTITKVTLRPTKYANSPHVTSNAAAAACNSPFDPRPWFQTDFRGLRT